MKSEIWGVNGFKGVQFMTVDGTGNLYTSEKGAKRISVFTPEGSYKAVWTIKTEGDTSNEYSYVVDQLSGPQGIATDSYGIVYVVDGSNSKVKKYSSDGKLIASWSEFGEEDKQLADPSALAIDRSSNVYIFDNSGTSGPAIKKFTSDGRFLEKWEAPSAVKGMGIDSTGNVYMVDSIKEKVFKISPTGTLITSWDGSGSTNSGFYDPQGIAVDSADNIYVTDKIPHTGARIQKFTSTGTLINSWVEDDYGWFGPIAVDRTGNIFVYYTRDNGSMVWKFAVPGSIAASVTGNIATVRSTTNPTRAEQGAAGQGATIKPTATRATGFGPLEMLGLMIVAVGIGVVKRRR